jgi:hypothetical protein
MAWLKNAQASSRMSSHKAALPPPLPQGERQC